MVGPLGKRLTAGLVGLGLVTATLMAGAGPAQGTASAAPVAGSAVAVARLAPTPRAPTSAAALAALANDRPDVAQPPSGTAAATAAVPTGTWTALGPAPIGPPFLAFGGFYGGNNSGRITGVVAIDSGPHAGRVVAASASGGLWTSDDTGTTWLARSDRAPSLAIGSVTVDPGNANHLIAGTGEDNHCGDCAPGAGILSSVDAGTTWSVQNPGGVFTGLHVASVAIDPSNPSHMFAATDGGLFVTSNGGTNWAKPTDSSYGAVDGDINSVAINPTTPATIYLGGGAATVAKSTNGGVAWAAAASGITPPAAGSFPIVALALAPSSPAMLYVSVGTFTSPVAVYKTTNSGVNWSHVTAPDFTGQSYAYGSGGGEQGYYDNVLSVDPTNANHVLAGGIALIETIDGGTTWANTNLKGFFAPGNNRDHPDHHALSFRADKQIWVGDDGGVWLYNPTSNAFTNKSGNLNITQFYHGFSEVAGTVLAGSQDNSSARTSRGTLAAWSGIFSGDGGPSAITPNHTQTQFVIQNQDLWMTTDAFATTFQNIAAPVRGAFTPPMIVVANTVDPTNPTVFYGGPDLYRTKNPTAPTPTWQKVTTVGTVVSAIAVSPVNINVIYVAFEDGTIQTSTNGGNTFTTLTREPFFENFVTGLSVDPANFRSITASVSYTDTRQYRDSPHVAQFTYTTNPTTGTWTTITGNLPAMAAVSRVIYDNGALVAATDSAVYATGAPAGSSTLWTLVGRGLPLVQVQDLAVDRNTQALYAATHGRGVWRLPGPLSITTTSLTGGKVAVSYTATLKANGGVPPYTWSITAGTLPPGLTLSASTGQLSGTPSVAGTSNISVTVTDRTTATVTVPLSLTISP